MADAQGMDCGLLSPQLPRELFGAGVEEAGAMHCNASAMFDHRAWAAQALKQRLVERANIIQGRRNDEAATLARREVRFTAKKGVAERVGR